MIDLTGKRGLVLGIANKRSIAYAVAKQLNALGAELALTYGPDPKGRFEGNVRELSEGWKVSHLLPLDVQDEAQMAAAFSTLQEDWGQLDFVLHSVAYADRGDLEKPFSETGRDGWDITMQVSAYSLVPLTKHAIPLLKAAGGGSIVGMTFIGSVLAVPNYNVMGPAKAALESSVRYLARELGPSNIRVNSVSAGAIRTLSSSGINKFGEMLKVAGEHAALERNVTLEEVANATTFLLSPQASGITGQTVYVDGGFNIMAN